MKKIIPIMFIGILLISGFQVSANIDSIEKQQMTESVIAKELTIKDDSKPNDVPTESAVKTFMWGPIWGLRIREKSITFRAINVHYRVIGQRESGVFMHKRITMDSEFKGTLRNHWVFAVFEGSPNYN